MKNKEDILKFLRDEAEQIEIPECLEPEQIKKMLKQHEAQKTAKKQREKKIHRRIFAVAASICIVVLGVAAVEIRQRTGSGQTESEETAYETERSEENVIMETADAGLKYPEISYEDIYESMSKTWEDSKLLVREEPTESGEPGANMAESSVMEESAVKESMSDFASANSVGTTNVQTAGVDEGDIVKNDGRYLYQKIQIEKENHVTWAVQVIDTQDGLKEIHRIGSFENIEEFYVWNDVLVVIEEKYLNETESASGSGMIACVDVAYFSNYYHEITFFNIKDRSQPKEIKTFSLQGRYASSRIADGYFYGFSKYYAEPGNGKSDYDAYIPIVDGIRLQAEKIYLPEESETTSYLVLVAIDLRNPNAFTDTTGIVSGADLFYASTDNIFVADSKSQETKEGWNSNGTSLLRFSYGDGKFTLRALGEVKGTLEGSFSMDEYEEHLRVVTTVEEYRTEKITDDRTGKVIGYNTLEDRQSNALYVLDETLAVVGKIEGLAENEQIYSARFLRETGYFVTFRQTDPLFAVDLKDPENPKVLSELKVSGFSEYLHIYGEDRLLGIGMEADEETGVQENMKLSMFDVSDKANVKEITKRNLTDYDYSEALYNHHAVMISTEKNIFGFAAEGCSGNKFYRNYFVYTYENDRFVEKLKVDAKSTDGNYYSVRGTFIGDIFYLFLGDGVVRSYDLNTGEMLESLEP